MFMCRPIPGQHFLGLAFSSSAFSVLHFPLLLFWSLKLDIIGPAFSGPAVAFSATPFTQYFTMSTSVALNSFITDTAICLRLTLCIHNACRTTFAQCSCVSVKPTRISSVVPSDP